ncbi:MAG TPA: PilZ domain-containing protein, partial [Stellaceae bacterium]|nr:PilZ domain-containing protein [Stellaceae bacterium]
MIEQAEAARSAKPKVRELRQGIRKKSLLPATLVTESGSTDCHVLDLSRGGARVSSPVAVVEEQAVTLIVKPIGTFAGLVAWRGDGGFGVKFLAQHGMASPPPASVEAAVADAIETPIPADEGEGEGDAAALLRKVERAHADEPASEPRPAKRSRKPRPEPKQPALELRDGDIICLLRRKDPADEAAATGASDAPRRRMKDLTEFELVQLDGKHFMTLLEQRAAYSIELMRVASGAEDHSEAEQTREVVEPKAAP